METIDKPWWREETRATIALAYPLVLTNLAQALIQTTDVVLLGWAGPRFLAAGALGVNLFNACMVFGVGLVTASAPMMARALGARSHPVSRRASHRASGAVGRTRGVAADVGAALARRGDPARLSSGRWPCPRCRAAGAADDVRRPAADGLFRAALVRVSAPAAGLGVPRRGCRSRFSTHF